MGIDLLTHATPSDGRKIRRDLPEREDDDWYSKACARRVKIVHRHLHDALCLWIVHRFGGGAATGPAVAPPTELNQNISVGQPCSATNNTTGAVLVGGIRLTPAAGTLAKLDLVDLHWSFCKVSLLVTWSKLMTPRFEAMFAVVNLFRKA